MNGFLFSDHIIYKDTNAYSSTHPVCTGGKILMTSLDVVGVLLEDDGLLLMVRGGE